MEYVEAYSGLVQRARQRLQLDVWLGWISTLLILDRVRDEEPRIPNSGRRFLITELDCLQPCGHSDFEVEEPGRNPGLFTIVTGRERSSLWTSPGSYSFVYCPPLMKKMLSIRLYMEEVIVSALSAFVGEVYRQYRDSVWKGMAD